MKKQWIIVLLGSFCMTLNAQQDRQENTEQTDVDSISLGYGLYREVKMAPASAAVIEKKAFANSPHIDIAKALYGKVAGLNVAQGKGESVNNVASFSLHGHTPIVLVDGFIRDVTNLTTDEIESVTVLKDAVASALYGVRGANGVISITTKRGSDRGLRIAAKYQLGINTQFRSPEFADAYTYASNMNQALKLDGLDMKYQLVELEAFKSGSYPFLYPNVDWWNETYDKAATNHRLNVTFDGGNKRFRYYTVVDYMFDRGLMKNLSNDDRYGSKLTDTRLNIRANIDAELTRTTKLKLGIVGKISEDNKPNFGDFYTLLYNTPSLAFPIRQENGTFGGSAIYGANNPYALIAATGNHRNTYATLLADAVLTQRLDALVKGLSAEFRVSFDDSGRMYDATHKEYQYMELVPILANGTIEGSTPIVYGKNSETLDHSDGLMSVYARTTVQGKLNYEWRHKAHALNAALIYDQQSYSANGRNRSTKRQSAMATLSYDYDNRYSLSGVVNYSGTAYLPDGDRFHTYPAVSATWNVLNERFLRHVNLNQFKVYASYGLSGWDGSLQHELYLQNYGKGNPYNFTSAATSFEGFAEGAYPVEGLTLEKARKATLGFTLGALQQRLNLTMEGFWEKRSDILTASNVSGIFGIEVGQMNAGIQKYKGMDIALSWRDKAGDFCYGIGASFSYLNSEIVEDNQPFQPYDYLYHRGNKVGQCYGLEATGFFKDEDDIKKSFPQTFNPDGVRPGDVKYKDQNGDRVIDDLDCVKLGNSTIPTGYWGLNLDCSYKNFELVADFQGVTGRTVSLLDSPLYQPLVNNGNLSSYFLEHEVPWTESTAEYATMPRLTTKKNSNNYRASSLWYRNGSFFKLRNLMLAYTFPKKMVRFADVKVYLQGTNLFSIDHIDFADPEQLSANYPTTRAYWLGLKMNF